MVEVVAERPVLGPKRLFAKQPWLLWLLKLPDTYFDIDFHTKIAITAIAALTLGRLWLAFQIGLGVDESYASTIARELNLSYYDDPPLHFWIAHGSMLLLGAGRVARIPFVLIGGATSWLVYALSRRLFGSRAGLWTLAVYSLVPFFTLISSSWILPDGPLNLLLVASALQLSKILVTTGYETPRVRVFIGAGVLIGLAALTKYHALLFGLGLIVFAATSARYRNNFEKPGFYIALAVALLLTVPIWLWNAEHHWASFALQGHRAAGGGGVHLSHMWSQIAGQFGLLGPWLAVPMGFALHKSWVDRSDDRQRFLLFLSLPTILFFTVVPIFGIKGFPHWTMPGWIFALPLLGRYLADDACLAWNRTWLKASAAAVLILLAAADTELQSGWLGKEFPRVFGGSDPTVEALEWNQLASDPVAHAASSRGWEFVSTNWRDGGKIAQAMGPKAQVIVLPDDPHGFMFTREASGRIGERALLVVRQSDLKASLTELNRYFGALQVIGRAAIGRNGRDEIPLALVAGKQSHLLPYGD